MKVDAMPTAPSNEHPDFQADSTTRTRQREQRRRFLTSVTAIALAGPAMAQTPAPAVPAHLSGTPGGCYDPR